MRKSVVQLVASVLCGGLFVVAAGCGDSGPAKSKLFAVTGTVSGATSFADCTVSLVSTGGGEIRVFGGKIGPDGSYSLKASDGRDGAEPGKYKVVFQPAAAAAMQAMMSGGGGTAGGPPQVAAPFPDEYKNAATSPKEVEVKAELNTINLTIP
jgi:hypothetical protein